MAKGSGNSRVPDPRRELARSEDTYKKYSFGNPSSNFNEIKSSKPIFAFDYISLKSSKFCFNSDLIDAKKDYVRLLDKLKSLSTVSYGEMAEGKRIYKFHEVDFDDVSFSASEFAKCLVSDIRKVNIDDTPTVYQFEAFEEARVFGFIFKSVFYMVLFDRNHNGYKRK